MTLPHGMTKIVKESWENIDKVVSAEMHHPGLLSGIDPGDGMYGCGYWGCAYPTNDPKFAIKITADPTEGPIVSAILNRPYLRNHAGIAYIKKIWKLPKQARWGTGPYRNIYVILREDITPIEEDAETVEDLDAYGLLSDIRDVGYEFNFAINHFDPIGEAEAEEEWHELIKQASDCWLTHRIADFMQIFKDEFTYVLADIHGGNIGYRNNNNDLPWVAFDVGHSNVNAGFDIPFVSSPPVIEETPARVFTKKKSTYQKSSPYSRKSYVKKTTPHENE